MRNKNGLFRMLSPDGFDMYMGKTYKTEKEAWDDFDDWKERYRSQGHYSSKGNKIKLGILKQHMTLKKYNYG